MLESGLIFILGFLGAVLLALMIAPAIWRRAVVLTRHRIESSVPLTMSEILADKDRLRAEFAMSTRRLELNMESLKEQAAEQLIELNRKRDEMLSLEGDNAEMSLRIVELETQVTQLRDGLKKNEDKLAVASSDMSAIQLRFDEKSIAHEKLQRKLHTTVDEFNARRIDMVTREGRMDLIEEEAREAKLKTKQLVSERAGLRKELKASKVALKKEHVRVDKLDKKNRTLADLPRRHGRSPGAPGCRYRSIAQQKRPT